MVAKDDHHGVIRASVRRTAFARTFDIIIASRRAAAGFGGSRLALRRGRNTARTQKEERGYRNTERVPRRAERYSSPGRCTAAPSVDCRSAEADPLRTRLAPSAR